MKWIIWLVSAVFLAGCTAQHDVRETVNDCMPEQVPVWTENSYDFIFGVPEHVAVTYAQDDCVCYMSDDEALEIYTVKLLSSSIESSVRLLSGTDADRICIMRSSRFSLPEYRFCWCAYSDEGGRIYYADVVIDDIYTYGIICSVQEAYWSEYAQPVEHVFSTFGLFFDEGI